MLSLPILSLLLLLLFFSLCFSLCISLSHKQPTVLPSSRLCGARRLPTTMDDLPMDVDKVDHVMLHGDDNLNITDHDDAYYSSDMSLDTTQRDPSIFSDDSLPATPAVSKYSFFTLPAELRELVYAELLLSDSAFRLGHHGPYSHEKRRQLYPQILRVCRTIHDEASRVLYGDNTFYLGMSLVLP